MFYLLFFVDEKNPMVVGSLYFFLLFCLDAKKQQKKIKTNPNGSARFVGPRHVTSSLYFKSIHRQNLCLTAFIALFISNFNQVADCFFSNIKIEKYHGRSRFNEILSVGIPSVKNCFQFLVIGCNQKAPTLSYSAGGFEGWPSEKIALRKFSGKE